MSRNAEARIQASIVAWTPTVAPEVLIFSVPNGGLRTKAEASLFKWTGQLAGVPDLAIISPGPQIRFIEVKTPVGQLSAAQREMIGRLKALGIECIVAKSIDDVRAAFAEWAIPTREAADG